MKGVVFTEFLDFVAARFGEDMVDDIIDASDLPSGGAYTAVGTYSHAEMASLGGALAARSGLPIPALLRDFGEHLSARFAKHYPAFFSRSSELFDFLESIEGHIHVEVRKLYPDAELPSFTIESRAPDRLVMLYRSPRHLEALAEGLILGSARQFGVAVRVRHEPLEASDGEGARFVIERR